MISNKRGFSLVEVMVVSSIMVVGAMAIVKFQGQSQNTNKKMEKRLSALSLKQDLQIILSDTSAWANNPSEELPSNDNRSKYYFEKSKKVGLVPLTQIGAESDQDPLFKCPQGIKSCHLAFFDYFGRHLSGDEVGGKSNIFRAYIEQEEGQGKVTRSRPPILKVVIEDMARSSDARLNRMMFYVNRYIKKGAPNSVARSACYKKLMSYSYGFKDIVIDVCKNATNKYYGDCFVKAKKMTELTTKEVGVLCNKSTSIAPIHCFEESKKIAGNLRKVSRLILCSGAKSNAPLNCYKTLKERQVSSQIRDTYGIKVCARSLDASPANCLADLYKLGEHGLNSTLFLCPHHKL